MAQLVITEAALPMDINPSALGHLNEILDKMC